jgi:hypothetical protein
MKEKIKENIKNPEELERLYNHDKKSFESVFEEVFSETENTELLKFWKIRLDFDKTSVKLKRTNHTDIIIMVAACLVSGFLIKIPAIFNHNSDNIIFYEKNAGLIVF